MPYLFRNFVMADDSFSKMSSAYHLQLFEEAETAALKDETYSKIHDQLSHSENGCRIKCIEFGDFEMETLYASRYPDDFARLEKLFICEYCLHYYSSPKIFSRHAAKCSMLSPPGKQIYRKGNYSFFEMDGRLFTKYCKNLCLLAKLFLDHKTLTHEVEHFLFYVLTVRFHDRSRMVGYFSKEKKSYHNYNLSCILTLPAFRRQGFGKMLIDFSYLLSRVEGKVGSPERPLSDEGLLSYRAYWKHILMKYICHICGPSISIKDMSLETGIHANDIVSTLQFMGVLKYWKGSHIILKKEDLIHEYLDKYPLDVLLQPLTDPRCLAWSSKRDSLTAVKS